MTLKCLVQNSNFLCIFTFRWWPECAVSFMSLMTFLSDVICQSVSCIGGLGLSCLLWPFCLMTCQSVSCIGGSLPVIHVTILDLCCLWYIGLDFFFFCIIHCVSIWIIPGLAFPFFFFKAKSAISSRQFLSPFWMYLPLLSCTVIPNRIISISMSRGMHFLDVIWPGTCLPDILSLYLCLTQNFLS